MSLRSRKKLNASGKDDLPEGWIVKKSTSRDRNFYFNEITGVSTWTKPSKTVTDDRTSSIKAQCSRTGDASVIRRPQGTLPKPLLLPASTNQNKSRIKHVETVSVPTAENVAKKVSFSVKQRPSLQRPSNAFSNNPITNNKNSTKSDRSCHESISGNITKGSKYRRKAKSLEASVSSIHKEENSKAAMQSSGYCLKKIIDAEAIPEVTQSMFRQPVNEKNQKNDNFKAQQLRKRHSFPYTKSPPAISKRNKLTQEELVRRYDKTHPCKVFKPEPNKDDKTLLGKRSKVERTSSLRINNATLPFKDGEEIDMEWEDIENEKVLFNIQEHRQQFQETKKENFDSPPIDMEVQYFDFSDNVNKDCVIVLDTNVLISDVKFVERLIENELKGIGHPTLVIPWMVLKELDALKGKSADRNSALERNARRAIHFIHQCFNSHNPWIKGQSALDDKDECFKVDSPDDSILNCCLQLHNKNKKVILLSNDINLCNKAAANRVRSFGKEQLEKKIQYEDLELLFVAKNRSGNGHPGTTIENSSFVVDKNQREQPRNEVLLLKFKSLLHQFLSKFLETEMKSVFGNMWLKIVYLKPPWTLLDLLQCFSKHWCAVFCFVMANPAKNNVEELIKFFRKPFSGQSIKDIEDVINFAIRLCQAVTSKNYSDLASEYKNYFQDLLKEGNRKVEGVTAESQDFVSLSSFPSSGSAPDNNGAVVVFEAFQLSLSLVNNFCGVLCDVVGIPCGISYDKPERLISWEELKERLPTVSKCLEDLICSMRSVLEVPECYLTVQHPALIRLHASLIAVIPSDNQIVGAISCERLHSFAVGENTRMMLANGLSQFSNYQLLMAKVINGDMNR